MRAYAEADGQQVESTKRHRLGEFFLSGPSRAVGLRRIPPCAARSCTASRERRSPSRSRSRSPAWATIPTHSRTPRRSCSASCKASPSSCRSRRPGTSSSSPGLADWTYLKENDRFNQTFDVALHLGTLVAVGAYFWADVVRLVGAFVRSLGRRRIDSPDERIAWFVLVATIPAGIVGLVGEDAIADSLGEPWQIAILLAAGAVLLWWADRTPQERAMGDLGLRHAVAMGLAQALALAPGVSRSGITITAGRFMRLDRDAAARFSFLLLLPTVLGALVLKGVGDVLLGDLPVAGKDRSSSERSPHSRAASSRSTGCSATSADTRTTCSSGTGSS